MDENYKKIANAFIIIVLLALSFFIIKPIIVSIIVALIFAYVFSPVYDRINKKIKNKSISAFLILAILLLIVIIPVWILAPILLRQTIEVFQAAQNIDFATPIKSVFPGLFASESTSTEIGYALSSLTTDAIDAIMNSLTRFIVSIPVLLLHVFVIFFVLFFVIREKEMVVDYIKSLLPFSKEVEEKMFQQTKGITSSIIYGQFIVGILQGIVVGLGYFIFGISNALFLTILSVLVGIIPIIGTAIIWIPVTIYLFSSGSFLPAWGIIIFGIISSNVDNILRPMIVSRRTNINAGILFVSMIGGLFFFGVFGLILGPLVISYLFILMELYRERGKSGMVT